MYYLSTSCLVFFFLFTLFHNLPCATSKQRLGWCEPLFQCGNITAGSRSKPCGHPLLKLHCNKNITSLNITNHEYNVFDIDQTSNTLRLARAHLLGSFCSATFNTTTLPPQIFELSPTYKSLTVLYNCDPKTSHRSSYTCPALGHFSMSQSLDHHNSCHNNFTVNVPLSFFPEERDLNLTHLESSLRNGFEVKLVSDEIPCQECSSTSGICGFNSTTQICCNVTSPPGGDSCVPQHKPSGKSDNKFYLFNDSTGFGFVFMLTFIAFLSLPAVIAFMILLCHIFGVHCFRKRKTSDDIKKEKLNALIPLKYYTYAEVKRMTKSFAEVIGRGGFGIVYRGTLCDGHIVAVKVLKDSKGNDEDFINEVASISQTSHINIVSLLGFCSEGSERAIIYEFLGNGSLDKFISEKSSMKLILTALYGIALGVARGLEYLHYGCKTRIVHFDIKPQNVLLDENLCPKVSDFGLSKLCKKRESILSLLDTRGTIGYIAPEMISRLYGSVSHKSDVYSYGMLVLEMIGSRKKKVDQNAASNASSMYFPEWIYKDLEKGDSGRFIENGIRNEEDEIAKKLTLVGLWCIESSPSNRPSMNRVVAMMEGSLKVLEVPPRPVLQQTLTEPLSDSFWISEEFSSASEVLICSTN